MIESEDVPSGAQRKPAPLLRRRLWLLWLTAGLASLIILGTSAYVIHATVRAERGQAAIEARLAADAFTQHSIELTQHVDALLSGTRWVYRQTGSLTATERYMDTLKFDRSVVYNLYLIDPQGTVLISHDPAILNLSVADRDYFHFHRETPDDQIFISAVRPGRVTGELRFSMTRRIDNPDGSFGGVVLAALDPESFADYFSGLHMGGENLVSLVGTADRLPRARVPKPDPAKWAVPITSPLWSALAQAPTGTFENTSPIDGIFRFFSYHKVDNLPLVMLVGFSRKDLDHRVSARIVWLWPVATSVALIFMALVLVTVVLRGRERLATANRALRQLALFDPLTGLASRTLFADRLDHCLLLAKRSRSATALWCMDLDDFKSINDSAGHAAGDEVLKTVSRRMLDTVRSTDTVCRWGGDEFLILMPYCDGGQDLTEVAERLIARVSAPMEIKGGERRVSASIGVARFPEDGQTPETLQAAADAAMYRAKQEGKGRVVSAADLH
ncbi:sensor domain-containing diguanylate cyclase [uncultured Thiodictyon sp.]|uniref:sensor domain-containing diguanylate cyclase n=1 Tax=uncultured Thiodictyon sp. TaxID=1846217 RepID=UPI0025F73EBA|nr:sensor domain-containing diguanylate cyclase [uncultured Thiodictyon sp.]